MALQQGGQYTLQERNRQETRLADNFASHQVIIRRLHSFSFTLARPTVLTSHLVGLLLLYSNLGAYNELGICWHRRIKYIQKFRLEIFWRTGKKMEYKVEVDIREIIFEQRRQIS